MTIPLITTEAYTNMRQLAKDCKKNRSKFLAGLPRMLLDLPPPHRVLLQHTLRVLRRVTEFADVNRMSTENVARIFAAGMLPTATVDYAGATGASMMEMQEDSDRQIWMLKLLIDSQDRVFIDLDKLVAAQLGCNPNVQLTRDEAIAECCHDPNRWRFFYPQEPQASTTLSGVCVCMCVCVCVCMCHLAPLCVCLPCKHEQEQERAGGGLRLIVNQPHKKKRPKKKWSGGCPHRR